MNDKEKVLLQQDERIAIPANGWESGLQSTCPECGQMFSGRMQALTLKNADSKNTSIANNMQQRTQDQDEQIVISKEKEANEANNKIIGYFLQGKCEHCGKQVRSDSFYCIPFTPKQWI